MNCPTTDKLLLYIDKLVTSDEMNEITNHIHSCNACKSVVESFKEDDLFLKETLVMPTLPEDFTSSVIDMLEPYEQRKIHKKPSPWKRIMLTAAGVLLGFGVLSTFNPAFAQWVEGLFSTNQVDEGLQMANKAGYAKRVNQEVTNNGITFKVEDVVADTSRVVLSYQIIKNGRVIKSPNLLFPDEKNDVFITDKNGKKLNIYSSSMTGEEGYGSIEFSLREQQSLDKIIVKFHLVELQGKNGEWKLEVPVDLTASQKATKTIALNEATTSQNGVQINMKEARYAPSSSELMYETSFVKEEQAQLMKKVKSFEEKYGNEAIVFSNYGTALQYHIENEQGKIISSHNSFEEGKGHPTDSALIQGSGQPVGVGIEDIGHYLWNESFIPQKKPSKLTFVLDGVVKTIPSEFSINIKPKELKKNPVTFNYKGNYFTIKSVKKHTEFSLQKSLMPLKMNPYFEIELVGGKAVPAAELNTWVLIDNKGKSYETYRSGEILNEKDKHGRFKSKYQLRCYGLDEVPEELTLRLLSETRYYEAKDKWRVPIN